MMNGVPLETCWAFKKLWNNKFYYKAASCWYFYWVSPVSTSWIIQIFFFLCWLLSTCRSYCSLWSHSMTYTYLVGLLWTTDRPLLETSAWQHITLTTNKHPCPSDVIELGFSLVQSFPKIYFTLFFPSLPLATFRFLTGFPTTILYSFLNCPHSSTSSNV